MNFYYSASDIPSPFYGLTKHKIGHRQFLYLDNGWTKKENYFFKGISSSWCKIFFDPTIRIETNKLRDFPIYYNNDTISNFKKLDKTVPVDGLIEIDKEINITYQENFYPNINSKQISFKDCHNILFDALIENVSTFHSQNKKLVLIPVQNGIDTLTVRSVFDFLDISYDTFDLPSKQPQMSRVGTELAKNHWGFRQLQEKEDSVIVTGYYGDEWILRNPYYAHVILSGRGVNITEEFDKTENCYMKGFFEKNYRKKCSKSSDTSIEKLMTQICNDFQIWHLHNTYFFSPLKQMSLLALLSADTDTILRQITNAELSRSIIEKCNPALISLIDREKNYKDPLWFDKPPVEISTMRSN